MNNKLEERIDALVKLGEALRADDGLEDVIVRAAAYNPWFTVGFCRSAIEAIYEKMLSLQKLEQWLSRYEMEDDDPAKIIGIIMAGNIPLVGFHDFLCVYISGHKIKIKMSGKDEVLFTYIYNKLLEIDMSLKDKSAIVDRLENFDAVIATGSNNTNRYFEYYFRDYPKILRKNRNSIAILDGNESDEDLYMLADDIFMYFGFGCRNVSKLYVPEDYDITRLFPFFEKYRWMHSHTKYMNNYDYNRTLLLMNRTEHLANEIIMLQENNAISSPVSVLYYEMYKNVKSLTADLHSQIDSVQCVVLGIDSSLIGLSKNKVPFGGTQKPELWEYADNVDILTFCISLNPVLKGGKV